ncbi:hypothetical protein BHE74_00053855, partial [Ensete ventricosum]
MDCTPEVFAVFPSVWRCLVATFRWAMLLPMALNSVAVSFLVVNFLRAGDNSAGPAFVIFVLLPLYLVAIVNARVVWHLSSIFSVLEDARGLEATQLIQECYRRRQS